MTDIQDFLEENIRPGLRYALMGVGSELRSDDGAGIHFIRCLSERLRSRDVLLMEGSTAPENFTGVIKDFAPDILFIIDAAHMGSRPGEARIIPESDIAGASFSTHMLPLSIILSYIEAEAGCKTIFIGIQPATTEHGIGMSDEVRIAAERLAEEFARAFERINMQP
jgi:hydrogenase maturation protease HycI